MEEILKRPIEVPIATCYKMRSDDESWHVLTGKVSTPFVRGAKTLRVFYPDLNVEAPFFVDVEELKVRRGVLWAAGYPEDLDHYRIAETFLEKVEEDRVETLKHLETLSSQIAFLKCEMAVWADK